MISFKQLKYALAVEKTLHFKKASEMCHVSPSALSTALTELENHLGLQVFERDNKKVLVTPLGKEVLKRARNIMLEVTDLQNLADSQDSSLSFPITIGIIPTIAPYLLPKIFPILNEAYPKAQIDIVEEQSEVLVNLVRSGEIDTAILALPYPHKGLLSLEFWQEDFFWIEKKSNELPQPKEITSKELQEGNLLLLKDGHCLKDHILEVCKFSLNDNSNNLAATSLNTLVQMVQAGLGTTLIPAMAMEQLVDNNPQIYAAHLGEPSPHRRLSFLIRPNYTRLSSIEAMVDICQETLNQF